jgi:hypothetical protein
MRNLKTTMIAVLLMFAAVGESVAQEKWEYATLSYVLSQQRIIISINGTEIKKIDAKDNSRDYHDTNPALAEISKMNNEGWEVFSTGSVAGSSASNVMVFYLRKKRN